MPPRAGKSSNNKPVLVAEDKWNELSPDQQKILTVLGIKVKRKEKLDLPAREVLVYPVTRYVLGLITSCSLCGEESYDTFDMVVDKEGGKPYLKAKKVSDTNTFPKRWQLRKVRGCRLCPVSLRRFNKTQLIAALIQAYSCGTLPSAKECVLSCTFKPIEQMKDVKED